MYVIIVYDVGEKRVGKMLKLCRQCICVGFRTLFWRENYLKQNFENLR